ncbi:MAG TPA: hypothetical protein VFJ16_12440 [Longimicrobium sp.]|nr:hypothetical protein [Longimicrobium sp.]
MSEQNQEPQATELTDENLENVAGGIIDGGCIPPCFPEPTPTFPVPIDILY